MHSLKHINAYLYLHGKDVSKGAVDKFLSMLQDDIKSGRITKAKDKFHKEVDRIQRSLVGMSNVMGVGEVVKVEIETPRKKHYEKCLSGQGLGNLSIMIAGALTSLTEHHIHKLIGTKKAGLSGVDSEIVLNEGNGKIINSIYKQWQKIKNQKQHDSWSKKVSTTKFGTYGNIPFLEVLEKFEPKFPNDIIKRDFYSEIKASLSGVKITGKGSRAKNEYNKMVDSYKWYVVFMPEKRIITGFESKDDCKQELIDNGNEKDKDYKIIAKSALKKFGIEIPNEKWKFTSGLSGDISEAEKNKWIEIHTKQLEKAELDLEKANTKAGIIEAKKQIKWLKGALKNAKALTVHGLNGPSKEKIIEAHKQIDSHIKDAQNAYDKAQENRLAYIKKHGYPSGNDKEFDKLVTTKVDAEDRLNRLKTAKENLLPLDGIKQDQKKLKKYLTKKGERLTHGYKIAKRKRGKVVRKTKKIVTKKKVAPVKKIEVKKLPAAKKKVLKKVSFVFKRKPETFEEAVLLYFLKNGKITPDDFKRYTGFGVKNERTGKTHGLKEFRTYIWALKNKSISIDNLVHVLWVEDMEMPESNFDEQELINEFFDILTSFNGKKAMMKQLLDLQTKSVSDEYASPAQMREAEEAEEAEMFFNTYPLSDKEIESFIAEQKYRNEFEKKYNELAGTSKELRKGIKEEGKEHTSTLKKLAKGKISVKEAVKETAQAHLKKDKKYYTDLEKAGLGVKKTVGAIDSKTEDLINKLKDEYLQDPRSFDFTASMYLSGPGNKNLRQQIMEYLTGTKMPHSKCGYHAVVDKLKINFDQTKLFGPQKSARKKDGLVGKKKVAKVMREFKAGKLHSGSKRGPVVKNRKQAVAIALNEQRNEELGTISSTVNKVLSEMRDNKKPSVAKKHNTHALPVSKQVVREVVTPVVESHAVVAEETHQPAQVQHSVIRTEGTISGAEMGNMTFEKLKLNDYYKGIFGEPATNFDMCIDGSPGSGKTTFLLMFANYLADFQGPTLFVTTEEFGSATLIDKINRFNIKSRNLHFAKKVPAFDELKKYKFIFIDSINHAKITIEQYQQMREKAPKTAFILVLQQTKGGSYKGSTDWPHEVEITMSLFKNEFDERMLKISKDRYTDPVPRIVKI